MYIEAEVSLTFDISLEVGHLKVIIDPVHDEIGEPRSLTGCLEQFVEQLQWFLAEVIAKYFEAHESRVVEEALSQEGKSVVFNVIISEIKMYQRLVCWDCLCKGFSSVIWTFIVRQVQWF